MTFGEPEWFWAMLLLPALLAVFFWNEQRSRELLGKLVALRLMPTLAGNVSRARRVSKFALLLLGLGLVIAGLAEPRLGFTVEETKNRGRDVLIAIDTSKSMLATDISPSRLARAKLAAEDLIRSLPGDRTGLIAFAGEAFLEAPMTIDYGAVLDSIRELDVNTIPVGGTNIAQAIDMAAEAFGKGEGQNDCLVLFTDGEELDGNVVEAAKRQQGRFRIYTVGLGSKEGAIIPIPEENGATGFVKDADGGIVHSKLDEEKLGEIAKATGGFYTHLQNGPADMKRIVDEGIANMKETEFSEKLSRKPIERYQWPLGAGVFFVCVSLLLNERKRIRGGKMAGAAAALAVWLHPGVVHATNHGVDLYQQKDYKGSYEDFHKQMEGDPGSDALQFDQGAAAYQLGNYDEAIAAFGKALISNNPHLHEKAEYNLGNSLFKRSEPEQRPKPARISDLKNAIQHYDEALKADARDTDAAYNKALAEQRLKDLMQEEKQPPKQDKKDQQQKDQKDQKDQDKKDQQQKDQDQKNQIQRTRSSRTKRVSSKAKTRRGSRKIKRASKARMIRRGSSRANSRMASPDRIRRTTSNQTISQENSRERMIKRGNRERTRGNPGSKGNSHRSSLTRSPGMRRGLPRRGRRARFPRQIGNCPERLKSAEARLQRRESLSKRRKP